MRSMIEAGHAGLYQGRISQISKLLGPGQRFLAHFTVGDPQAKLIEKKNPKFASGRWKWVDGIDRHRGLTHA